MLKSCINIRRKGSSTWVQMTTQNPAIIKYMSNYMAEQRMLCNILLTVTPLPFFYSLMVQIKCEFFELKLQNIVSSSDKREAIWSSAVIPIFRHILMSFFTYDGCFFFHLAWKSYIHTTHFVHHLFITKCQLDRFWS